MLPVDAIPPLVANPSTVILATAVGTPEPNLTRLHIAALDDATVIVDDALIANTPTALVVATALAVCGLVRTRITLSVMLDVVVDVAVAILTLAPLPVVVTVVCEAPLIIAEPSGTRLTPTVIPELTVAVAKASRTRLASAVALDVAVTTVCKSSCPPLKTPTP